LLDSLFKSTVSAFEIPWGRPSVGEKEKSYLADAIESTWISAGPYVDRFEAEFPRRIRGPQGLAVSSGTAALQLAVMALGLKPGDEVIVPGFSFVTPVNVVIAAGAKPVYADVDASSWCLDPKTFEESITPRTKAVIAVHVYGNVCDMDAIMAIARRHNIVVIEDAAEAAFSTRNGCYSGTFGDIGCFSFQATKTLTMGEGGFVLSPDGQWVSDMRCMRDHGMNPDKRYWHDRQGFNFRLTNLQAAVGCAQLERIEEIMAKRRRVYAAYAQHLSRIPGVSRQEFAPGVSPVVWAVGVRLDPGICRRSRDQAIHSLGGEGIETRPGFYSFSDMPLYQAPVLNVSQSISGQILLLPSFADLTDGEIARVCEGLKRAVM
jgi:perosamine synthetase